MYEIGWNIFLMIVCYAHANESPPGGIKLYESLSDSIINIHTYMFRISTANWPFRSASLHTNMVRGGVSA